MNLRILFTKTVIIVALLLISIISKVFAQVKDISTNNNESQKFTKVLQLAESGDAQAQFEVACAYQTGRGVNVDDQKAVKWLSKAAEQGLVAAETALGSAYDIGMGVPLNNQKAIFWWQKAARHGSNYALKCLGYSYIEGRGVEQSNLYAYAIWQQLPPNDEEAVDVMKALRKNLSADDVSKAEKMTLDDIFETK